jgi:iron transport multicopper oxidase
MFPQIFLLLALHFTLITARTVHLTFDLDWVTVAPDGFNRPAIGINGQWPCPQIDVDVGDELWIDVHNRLGNETSSLHFHGILQIGSNQMDGPAMVTQCPIPPGSCKKLPSLFCKISLTFDKGSHTNLQYVLSSYSFL